MASGEPLTDISGQLSLETPQSASWSRLPIPDGRCRLGMLWGERRRSQITSGASVFRRGHGREGFGTSHRSSHPRHWRINASTARL